MPKTKYSGPKFRLSKIYTKGGDKGETSLANGRRISKDDVKIEAYGTIDELNAQVGVACVSARERALTSESLSKLVHILTRVQHELFNLGSILATDPEEIHPTQPRVHETDVRQLENEIDEMNSDLTVLPSFVLPGGCDLNAELHVCRTICRRAERIVITLSKQEDIQEYLICYLNRLSDAFFVWSRWVCLQLSMEEVLWQPNKASSGMADE